MMVCEGSMLFDGLLLRSLLVRVELLKETTELELHTFF